MSCHVTDKQDLLCHEKGPPTRWLALEVNGFFKHSPNHGTSCVVVETSHGVCDASVVPFSVLGALSVAASRGARFARAQSWRAAQWRAAHQHTCTCVHSSTSPKGPRRVLGLHVGSASSWEAYVPAVSLDGRRVHDAGL